MLTQRFDPRCSGVSAFSLLGILVVAAIVLALMFGSFGGNKSYVEQVQQTKKDGESMSIAIQAQQLAVLVTDFRLNNENKTPTSFADLKTDAASFTDKWGNPLRFRLEGPSPREARTLIVTSDGPDGAADTADDIVERIQLQI
ncbi:MAG: type II secretion system protein [Planctomycetota bacterium]|nr:type II secretion system protein [Planctomycetota bacterium]